MQLNTLVNNAEEKPTSLDKIISSSKKIALTALLVGSLSMIPLFGSAQKKKDPQIDKERAKKVFFLVDSNLTYNSPILSGVKGIPLEMRDVPKHPDDSYARESNVAPIAKDSAELYGYADIGTRLGGKFSLHEDKLLFNTGIGIDFSCTPAFSEYNKRKDMEVRNYTSNPGSNTRGSGAALTFYRVAPSSVLLNFGGVFLRPSAFGEIEVNVGKKASLALGYMVFPQNYQIENGWDRWNKLEFREKHTFAKLIMGGPYLSIKIKQEDDSRIGYHYTSVDIGITRILRKHLTEIGENMELDFNDFSFYIGVRFGIR